MLTAELDLSPGLVRHRRSELLRHTATADTVRDVFARASRRLPRLVPYDAAAWVMADPTTGLPSAPSLLDGFSAPVPTCAEHWRSGFVDADAVRFRHLARAVRPATALQAALTSPSPADPDGGARFRWCTQPLGFAGELRVVLRVDATPWAMLTLWRREERETFTAAETELMGSLSEPLGDAVRQAVRENLGVPRGDNDPPGVFTFDPDGGLLSANDRAAAWLEQLPRQELVPTGFGLSVPVWLLVTIARSARSLDTGGAGTTRTLVPTDHGQWLVGQATTTCDVSGAPAGTVVILEPAGPALMAPVIAGACGLTEREQEIADQIARGAGTAEIAEALFLSSHTVRDHVKSVLHKVGVCSRGELVATLYTEQRTPSASSRHLGSGPLTPGGPLERGMAAAAGRH